jgi:ABC-type multidrug transport system fused ATPase/permease subunit
MFRALVFRNFVFECGFMSCLAFIAGMTSRLIDSDAEELDAELVRASSRLATKFQGQKSRDIHSVNGLPQSWVTYLIQSEWRLFILAAVSKAIYNAGLLGITMLVLRIQAVTYGNTSESLRYCLIFLAVSCVYQLSGQANVYFSGQLSGRVKARLAALVSEHAILRASPEASERAIALTLASADAHQVCEGALVVHELWLSPLNILTVCGILIQNAGYKSYYGYIGGALCICVLLTMSYVSILLVRVRKAVSAVESKQVSIFIEAIEAIRTLRLYGWDTYMLQKLNNMTNSMMPLYRKLVMLKVVNIGVSIIVTPLISLFLYSIYASINGKLDSNYVYLIQSLFDITRYALLVLPSSIRAFSSASAAYARILEYFNRPSFEDKRELIQAEGVVQVVDLPVGPSSVLKEWSTQSGSVWVFQGPVRSFKTTILECIAGT